MINPCEDCSHNQNYDGKDRCSYYHDSICSKVEQFCKGQHHQRIEDGISLYALESWLSRLDQGEMELPLIFNALKSDLIPVMVVKQFSKDYPKGCWCFYSKPKGE